MREGKLWSPDDYTLSTHGSLAMALKWVEGMRTCRCGINGGKHLFKDCPVGGKPPSEQAARVAPHETEAPPPAATKSTDALTPAAISKQLADFFA